MANIKEQANKWWLKLPFITQWEMVVKYKHLITDYPYRAIASLTELEIQEMFKKEKQ